MNVGAATSRAGAEPAAGLSAPVTGGPGPPLRPPACPSHRARAGPLAAVVLHVVVSPELLAVVAAALQISPAAVMAVVTAAVSRAVTVALPLPTRLLRRAAPPALPRIQFCSLV